MTAIDWDAHPEPWRSIGLRFCRDLGINVDGPTRLDVGGSIRARRQALGITQAQLGMAAGYIRKAGGTTTSSVELGRAGKYAAGRILAALDRLEAERGTAAVSGEDSVFRCSPGHHTTVCGTEGKPSESVMSTANRPITWRTHQ